MRRNGRRPQVMAIRHLIAALAIVGAGCRDDGNDLFSADATTRGASDATSASATTDGGSSTASDPGSPTDSAAPEAGAAPPDTGPATGTQPPTGTEPTTGTQPTTGTDAPDSPDDPDDPDEPAVSGAPPTTTTTTPPTTTTTTPPTTTQPPVDTATREFCDAFVTAETTFNRGPVVDYATATPEEIAAAVDAHTATLASLLDAAAAAAPAAIAPDTETVVTLIRSSLTSGEDPTSNADYRAADERVDVFIARSCGYDTVAVSAVEYSFENLPTSLPAGRTTFAFTNNGVELHEMVVFRINDGVTETIDELLALPEDEAFAKVQFAGATFGAQGETDTETFELTPGRYVALCFVPVGTTSIEEEGAEPPGPPHFTEGMLAEFDVT